MNEAEHQQSIRDTVRRIGNELGAPDGFLESLRDESDWAFIIKVHALFEAAAGHLLHRVLGRPELAEPLSYLELSDKRRGKMAFISALGLLEKADRRFIASLSQLRNELVHDVRNASFDLRAHVKAMTKEQFKAFARDFNSFSLTPDDLVEVGSQSVRAEEAFRLDPKRAIWWSAMVTLSLIYDAREIERAKADTKHYEAILATFGRWLKPANE